MVRLGKAALVGGGVIGSGWGARLCLNGVRVCLHDPAPGVAEEAARVMAAAARAYEALFDGPPPVTGELQVVSTLEEAVEGADYVQESVPERMELKGEVLSRIDALAGEDVLVCSSTSGLLPTELQRFMAHPGRFVVAHPFNPVYLLPLVEIVAGEQTLPESVARAEELFTSLGMKPLVVRREIEAFVADRLMEALWREALWLVHDGIATTEDIDDAIRYGCGLRWAQMGVFQTFHLAGGESGMRHFLEQFGPALKWPWTKLMDTPPMDDRLMDMIDSQCREQAGDLTVEDLARRRDDNLVAILRALEGQGWGAGEVVRRIRSQGSGMGGLGGRD